MKKIIKLNEKDLTRIVNRVISETTDDSRENVLYRLIPKSVATIWKVEGWKLKTGIWKIENGKLYCKIPTPARWFSWWRSWVEISCDGQTVSGPDYAVRENASLEQKIKKFLLEQESKNNIETLSLDEFIKTCLENGKKNGLYSAENEKFLVRWDTDSNVLTPKKWIELTCD